MKQPMVSVFTMCPFCALYHIVTVDREAYNTWKAGELIQNAFPELTPSDRELLMTGICDDCFPKEDY